MIKSFCSVPWARAFVLPDGSFRNCCAADPQIVGHESDWNQWAQNPDFVQFKNRLAGTDQHLHECRFCEVQERHSGHSMRTVIPIATDYPSQWHVMFGNKCNLACWTCNEDFSSTIRAHKIKIGRLSPQAENANDWFERRWPELKKNILRSYDRHDIVTITLLGGEPTYNTLALEFLEELVVTGLSTRTRLEITTNGTKTTDRFMELADRRVWNHLHMIISVDAIGRKAEWLRWGCRWNDVSNNIAKYKQHANYIELHCLASVFNLHDLPVIHDWAKSQNIPLVIMPLHQPSFMSLESCDIKLPIDRSAFESRGLTEYVDLVGQDQQPGAWQQVCDYVSQLTVLREPVADFDPVLAALLS